MMNMYSTVARDKLQVKKSQVNCKRNFDRKLRGRNAKLKVGYDIFLDVQYGKANKKVDGNTDGPFLLLERTNRTFEI